MYPVVTGCFFALHHRGVGKGHRTALLSDCGEACICSVSLEKFFVVMSALSFIIIATTVFIWYMFIWCFFFHVSLSTCLSIMWKSLSCVRLFATPWIVACQAPLSMEFSRPEYWSGQLFPSPGDLPNPGIKPRFAFPHNRQILYNLSYQGSPRTLEWIAYLFSRASSWPRNRTGVSCIAGGFFTNWAIRNNKHLQNIYSKHYN